MHRSLNYERLDPMNAMNTHDALVINPMKMCVHLAVSPYRAYFPRIKNHRTNSIDLQLWERIKGSGDAGDVTANRLTPAEYGEILRDDMKYGLELVAEHLSILDAVKRFGNIGMDIQKFQVCNCLNQLTLYQSFITCQNTRFFLTSKTHKTKK